MAWKDSPKWFKTLNWVCMPIIAIGIIFVLIQVIVCGVFDACVSKSVFSTFLSLQIIIYPIAGLALLVLIVAWIVQKFKNLRKVNRKKV